MCRWCGRVAILKDQECGRCSTTGLRNAVAIRPYSTPVINWLNSQIGPNQLDRIPIYLLPAGEFSSVQYAETFWQAVNTDFSAEINLLEGIPPINAQEALAHEFAHVLLVVDPITWKFSGHHQLTPQEEEGFCEVIRALWIDHVGGANRDNRRTLLETNTIDTYRLGFFEMWSRYQRVNKIETFIQETLGQQRLPPDFPIPQPTASRIRINTLNSAATPLSPRMPIPVITKGHGHRPVIPIKNE